VQGVAFPPVTIAAIGKRLTSLTTQKGFNSLLELMTILNELSLSAGIQVLSTASPTVSRPDLKSSRLEKVFDYIRSNYERDITLSEIAAMVNMPQSSFSRFIKKRTGRTFVESLNDIRLGHAMRMLITTSQTVAEISYKCGFNNLSYFNRLFRRKNGCTPIEFRQNYADSKVFI
jgi:AraC-like DNA-binding protein